MSEPHKSDEAILAATRHLSGDERTAYLDATCGDPETRRRMESLLAKTPATGSSVEPAASDDGDKRTPVGPSGTLMVDDDATISDKPPAPLSAEEAIGDVIGRYKLVEKIGEGGFGMVYVAEQTEPVRRQVALKIIKLGMDTRQVVARFEAERQALALMDHPNIAKVLDGGATNTGRPYFVMELVHGTKITEHCDKNKLPIARRLDLFMMVCRAIEHAHQKGIIHRDIKPSNILVTMQDGQAVPKVIDFGIAKATQGNLTGETLFTQIDQFVGTPAYMSPEQATTGTLDIDTRSDIYSLGVLLYELLTGETPLESKNLLARGFDEMRRLIREWEPQKPSIRLHKQGAKDQTTTASRHGTDAPKLIKLVRGDLDWVVMTYLEKDRARRYDTAAQLASEIQRYLDNEPVKARPPSNLYRFQKLVRRNRLVFAAGGLILLSLIVALCVTSWFVVKEREERDNAEKASKNSDTARKIAVAEEQKAEAAQKEAEAARHQADAARQQAEVALLQARDDRNKAVAAEEKAEGSQKEAEAARQQAENALQQATEDRHKAGVAEKSAQNSQSEAQAAMQFAKIAEARAAAEVAKREEATKAADDDANLRAQAEAARKEAESTAAAALAEVGQTRQAVSNFLSQLDTLPPSIALEGAAALAMPDFEKQPWAAQLLGCRGEWHARQGDWIHAIADFSKALALNPGSVKSYDALAPLFAQMSDTNRLARYDARFAAQFGGTNDPATTGLVAKDCLFAPLSGVDIAKAAALARRGMEGGTDNGSLCDRELTMGLAEYRGGHFDEAAKWFAKTIDVCGQNAVCEAEARAALAMARQQLKQTDSARSSLDKSKQIIDTKLPKPESGDLGQDWRGWIIARCLAQEAATLLEASAVTK